MANIRELILAMLIEWEAGREYSHTIIRNVLYKYHYMQARDKAFIKRVAEGTIERQIQIDYILGLYAKTPVEKMKPFIRNLLRMGVYQLLWMDAVPDGAVCNEAVKLAQTHKFHGLKGFVNGVLRTVAREKERIPYPGRDNMCRFFSVVYSMPEWIVSMWRQAYDDATVETMLLALLQSRPVTVRMDERLTKQERERCIDGMRARGIIAREHPYLPYAFELSHTESIADLPEFSKGMLSVQDVSSMLAVCALQPKEGDAIIDVCAAPGGKTAHAACRMHGTGHVLARDVSEYKAGLIRETAERMHCDNVEIQVWDACILDETLLGAADAVIADLPCSGLGVAGKKSDIKYRMNKEMMDSLICLQKRILETVWQYVRPGGILLYSTCTIHRGENEDMAAWITKHLPFEPVSLKGVLPPALYGDTLERGYVQILPGVHQADGFFIAKFQRRMPE